MVREREEENRVVKVVQISTQGRLSEWEDIIEWKLIWKNLWKMDAVRVLAIEQCVRLFAI